MRVSELLTEKQKTEKHVVGLKDVDEVIAVMGQPEDYRIDDEETGNTTTKYSSTSNKLRKLYRDTENGMIGGVLAGLGHYFGIDKVWLRVFLLILFFAWGTGFLGLYHPLDCNARSKNNCRKTGNDWRTSNNFEY